MSLSASTNIHGKKMRLSAGETARDNSNGLTLTFNEADEPFYPHYQFTVFDLSDVTADCLSLLGRLSEGQRARILPALQHALSEQEAEDAPDEDEDAPDEDAPEWDAP